MKSIVKKPDVVTILNSYTDQAAIAFVWSVWLLMLIVPIIFIFTYVIDIPHNEDWFLIPPLVGKEPNLLKWLWDQNINSEHRVPFSRLFLLILLKISNGDTRAGMLFNTVILAGIALSMILLARHLRGGKTIFADAFFPIAFLHLGHSGNLFWSWQLTQVIPTVLTAVILIVLIGNSTLDKLKTSIIAGTALILLPLNGANGLIFVPILTLWLAYHGVRQWLLKSEEIQSRTGAFLIGSAIITMIITALYFYDYEDRSFYPPPQGFKEWLLASAKFLALSLGPIARNSWLISVTVIVAIVGSTLIIVISGILNNKGQERQRALGVFLFYCSIGIFALAMGWGRASAIPIVYGYWPIRYSLFAIPGLCATFFIWELYGPEKFRSIAQTTLFLTMLILIPFNSIQGYGWARWFEEKDKLFEKDLMLGVSIETLAERHHNVLVNWIERRKLVDLLKMMQEAKMGPFARIQKDRTKSKNFISNVASKSAQPHPFNINEIAAPIVTTEIRYKITEAQTVNIVWGLNGWQVVPEKLRPSGTDVKDNLMKTQMEKHGDTFTARLQVPAGTRLDYGFQVIRKKDALALTWPVWDGDYKQIAMENNVIEIKSKLKLSLVTQEFRYFNPEAGEVYLVWGLNGWHLAPESLRPPGTKVIKNLMNTPMAQEGDTFISAIKVPAGTKINYAFRITERRGILDIVYPIRDGDYQETPIENSSVQIEGKIPLDSTLSGILSNAHYFFIGIITFLITWFIFYLFLGLIKSKRQISTEL